MRATEPLRKTNRPIQILICEDHLIARVGLSAIINAQPDMSVVAEAVHGERALEMYRAHRPDVTLMDIRMPVMNGLEAISAILSEDPKASIVALSTFGGDGDARKAIQSGALAFLTKDAPQDDLLDAIRTAHAKEQYVTPLVARAMDEDSPMRHLSNREIEVLELLARGLSNKQIAYELKVAEDTVKNHVKSILKKLEVQDRTQAATEAIQRGIIHLQW